MNKTWSIVGLLALLWFSYKVGERVAFKQMENALMTDEGIKELCIQRLQRDSDP